MPAAQEEQGVYASDGGLCVGFMRGFMRQGLCVRRDWNLGLCVRRDWNFVGNAAEHIKVRSSRQKFQHGEVAADA